MKTKTLLILTGLAVGMTCAANDLATLKAKIAETQNITAVDKFHGFDRIKFDFDGYAAWVVCPSGETRPGTPWTWTMQWAEAFVPRTNVPQMLADGYHHVTIDTYADKMNDKGLAVSAAYQKFLVERLGFAPKAFLIGMSWGGFFSTRYAATYPQNVAKIYLDAPFLNFYGSESSVKGPIGIGPWAKDGPQNGSWMDDPRMPINIYRPIITAKIPVLLLYGGNDKVLNPSLNSELFIARFKRDGGDLTVVPRVNYGHHPHGVEVNELTIKAFFEKK